MEPIQNPIEQQPIVPNESSPVATQVFQAASPVSQPVPSKSKIPVWLIILLVLFVGLSSYLLFQNFQLKNQLIGSSGQTTSPSPSSTPTIPADWSTFDNSEYSFKYPNTWQINDNEIKSITPEIVLWAFSSDDPMYNECMKIDYTKTINGLMIKKYSAVSTAEACSSGDLTPRELWISKAGGEGFAPGIQYIYKSTEGSEAEKIFDQIVSTFKFAQ